MKRLTALLAGLLFAASLTGCGALFTALPPSRKAALLPLPQRNPPKSLPKNPPSRNLPSTPIWAQPSRKAKPWRKATSMTPFSLGIP